MAISVTNDASAFKRSANVPPQTSFSIWGWFFFTTVTPARFWGPLGLYDGADGAPTGSIDFIQISSASSGAAAQVLTYKTGVVNQSDAFFTPAANTWYFIAITGSGTAAGNVKAYARAITAAAFTTVSSSLTQGTITATRAEWGRDAFSGDFITGSMHAFGMDDVALSADELLNLSFYHEPQFGGIRSLNAFYPTIESVNANATVDRSGNARNATATVGALAEPPSLLWRPSWPRGPVLSNAAIAQSAILMGGICL